MSNVAIPFHDLIFRKEIFKNYSNSARCLHENVAPALI